MIHFDIYEGKTFYSGPKDELKVLVEILRVTDKNAYFRAKYQLQRAGYWEKPEGSDELKEYNRILESTRYIKFYDGRTKSFATGLLPLAKRQLQDEGVDYKKSDHRKETPDFTEKDAVFDFVDEVETRAEQVETLAKALIAKRGILHCSPNFGKTEVACGIISSWRKKTGKWPRVLFLIHRAGLAKQTQKRFEDHLGIEVARIGGGGKKKLKRITVATTQTAANLSDSVAFQEFLGKCDIMFIDELHVNKAGQLSKVALKCRAGFRFGLSGTIDMKDTVKMMRFVGLTGPIVSEVRNKELVEKGRSAKPIIRMVMVKAEKVDEELGFQESYRSAIVNNDYRNRIIRKEATRYVNKGYRCMILVARTKHGKMLREDIERKLDVPCEFIWGGTSLSNREYYKKKFVRGKVPILIASPIFDVGEDLPSIDAYINAAGGKGWELVLQRLGRAMRRKAGENKVRVTDFIDTHSGYMLKHSVKRLGYYLAEKMAEISIID